MGLLTFHGCLAESRGVPGPAPGPLETVCVHLHVLQPSEALFSREPRLSRGLPFSSVSIDMLHLDLIWLKHLALRRANSAHAASSWSSLYALQSSQSTHPVPAPAPSPADVPTPAIAASILPATPAPSLTPKSSPPSPPAPTAPAPTPPVHPQGDSCSGGCIAGEAQSVVLRTVLILVQSCASSSQLF